MFRTQNWKVFITYPFMEGRLKERNQVTVEEFHSYRHESLAEVLVTKWREFVFHGDCLGKRITDK
jgi:hypothetical protein